MDIIDENDREEVFGDSDDRVIRLEIQIYIKVYL